MTERSAAGSAFRIGLVVLAIVVLGRFVLRLHDTIGLIFLSGTLAIVTSPLQRAVRRRAGAGASYVLTALVTFALILAIAALLWNDLAHQSERLALLLTDRIDGLRPNTLPERVARLTDAEDGIAAVFDRLPTTVVAGEDSAVGVGSKVINFLVTVVLAAFLQAGAGGVFDWIVARWPRDDRAEVRDLIGDMVRRAGGLVRRALGIAVGASLLAVGLGPSSRQVGADRARLIAEARRVFAQDPRIATLDVGWVGAASNADVLDLAGVTDPEVALFPGGHTSKRIPGPWLFARHPTAVVLLLARGTELEIPFEDSIFARAVEQRVATLIASEFRVRTQLALGDQRYVVLERDDALVSHP